MPRQPYILTQKIYKLLHFNISEVEMHLVENECMWVKVVGREGERRREGKKYADRQTWETFSLQDREHWNIVIV